MEMRAAGPAQGVLKVVARPGVSSSRFPGLPLGTLLFKGLGETMLSTEPPETSEKPLPPVCPEAESLVS